MKPAYSSSSSTDSASSETIALLTKHSLPKLVQEALERMILDGRLVPGEALREASLAASLGVSRGPLREAFRALEQKGLVSIKKNIGVQVRILSIEEADQIYEVRVALEDLIGRKAAERLDAAGRTELSMIIGEMRLAAEAGEVARYTGLNLSFHDCLARCTGNGKLCETYGRLVAELSLFRRQAYLHDRSTMALSWREHHAIFDAVQSADGRLASELLRRHAQDSRERMHRALAPAMRGECGAEANRDDPEKG